MGYGLRLLRPQTFSDERGRRLLIAWAGMPDAPSSNPTEAYGWQHALTVPRRLTGNGGQILQSPVPELERLRRNGRPLLENTEFLLEDGSGDLLLTFPEQNCRPWKIQVGSGLRLSWEEGILRLELNASWGYGRTFRQLALRQCRSLRLLADTSLLEIYVNGGEQVLTTRFYPDYPGQGNRALPIKLACPGISGTGWQMDAMETNRHYF
ncbi:MAG TPA: GH32 C-terminal domain-containing protein [Candidatus Scatomonas pullistercoris]|uniref:GH32 C-terminal domain-containing protein n=1 Tax=Candidatus Scatomonas pullistercoris TaxID=2840920 RepID=A0A9D1P358_9FIRM|nr:GH32 C-terminal domain-containing protein [Candidatus Scatomonas pullistercoris]